MAKETRSFYTSKNMFQVVREISEWLEKEEGYPAPQHSYEGDAVTISTKLSSVLRATFGQVRKISITFKPIPGGFEATLDNGGWEKYAGTVSHLPVPVLSWITASVSIGTGVLVNAAIQEVVFSKIQEISQEKENYSTKTESDYIQLLELGENHSVLEIKRNYKKLMAQYHPDKVQHLGKEIQDIANKKALDINEAYSYLRKKYGFE